MWQWMAVGAVTMCAVGCSMVAADAVAKPDVPHIDSVVMARPQPQENDPAVIWYDDFDGDPKPYFEAEGPVVCQEAYGGGGRSMLSHYEKGSQGKGNRKVFFGDSPIGPVVRQGETFDEIYWRIYVKHPREWNGGGPAKLSRATSVVSGNWAQAMIAHVWSADDALTLDPASGVRGNSVVTTKYNDFPNLHWLGMEPRSRMRLFSPTETGRWVCVEARAKLNTPGKRDGVNQLWIDGRLEAERTGLDWRGGYTGHGINGVFLETYWNEGSPVTQSRWIDNFVISTQPVGPVVASRNPVLLKTPYCGPGTMKAWEVEVAADAEGDSVVWESSVLAAPERVKVDVDSGRFVHAQGKRHDLLGGETYYVRVRQQSSEGEWSDWSPWHQPFRTEG